MQKATGILIEFLWISWGSVTISTILSLLIQQRDVFFHFFHLFNFFQNMCNFQCMSCTSYVKFFSWVLYSFWYCYRMELFPSFHFQIVYFSCVDTQLIFLYRAHVLLYRKFWLPRGAGETLEVFPAGPGETSIACHLGRQLNDKAATYEHLQCCLMYLKLLLALTTKKETRILTVTLKL